MYDSSLNIVSARKLAVDLGLKNKEILSNFKDNLHTALEVTHPVEVDKLLLATPHFDGCTLQFLTDDVIDMCLESTPLYPVGDIRRSQKHWQANSHSNSSVTSVNNTTVADSSDGYLPEMTI